MKSPPLAETVWRGDAWGVVGDLHLSAGDCGARGIGYGAVNGAAEGLRAGEGAGEDGGDKSSRPNKQAAEVAAPTSRAIAAPRRVGLRRVGQPVLEPVQAVLEAARRPIVLGEPAKAGPARPGLGPQLAQRLGQRQAGPDSRVRLSTASGQTSRNTARRRGPAPDQGQRTPPAITPKQTPIAGTPSTVTTAPTSANRDQRRSTSRARGGDVDHAGLDQLVRQPRADGRTRSGLLRRRGQNDHQTQNTPAPSSSPTSAPATVTPPAGQQLGQVKTVARESAPGGEGNRRPAPGGRPGW